MGVGGEAAKPLPQNQGLKMRGVETESMAMVFCNSAPESSKTYSFSLHFHGLGGGVGCAGGPRIIEKTSIQLDFVVRLVRWVITGGPVMIQNANMFSAFS